MIDEMAYAGPEHLDAAFVAGFDRKQGYPDPAEDLDALAEQGLVADSTLVDLGTGTGQFALAAARRFGHVTAVDVSPAMLALLHERAGDAGLGNLDCVRAGGSTGVFSVSAASGSGLAPASSSLASWFCTSSTKRQRPS
jgi:SAM-dependent methyltransferase